MDDVRDPYRLPSTVTPSAYRLRLEPDLEHGTFVGAVEIDVTLAATSKEVVLNALDLVVTGGGAVPRGGTRREAAVSTDRETERVTLAFDEPLPEGAATLAMRFSGALNEQLVGLYRSTFVDAAGRTRTIATTQLCATDARRAFPCFDEPSLKATFELTAVVHAGLAAYSNTAVRSSTELDDGRREVVFGRTIPMSTYLVALVVGPLEATDPVDADGVELSVVCTPGRARLGAFAREVGAFALRFYAEYFGIPYPGEKVDLLGIPDFAFGAMENLGCVTFRETLLLVDPEHASSRELQDVAMVVTHELAHMWFGDLVTMAWWEGLWLNEAFATHMQYLCADAFRPEWRLWERFARERERGLEVDALHTTRPIEFPVRSPADAMGMIDPITYQKGGSVLRMLEHYLGPDVYRDGVRRYLKDHAYANTVTADLWAAFEAASGEPVGTIMDTWILQGGHPVVAADASGLTQSPFRYAPPEGTSAIGEHWRVPMRVRALAGGDPSAQLLDGPAPVAVARPAVLNAGGTGVYRSRYEPAELAQLAGSMERLTESERAALLGDTWALARAGACSMGDLLLVARGLGDVVEPAVWALVVDVLATLDLVVADGDRDALQAAASALLTPLLERLGWEPTDGEDPRAREVRAAAVRGLGVVARDVVVRDEAARRFDAGALEGDLAAPIVAVVASMARPGDAEELLARCRAATEPQDEERYRTGLAQVADREQAVQTFGRCFEWFRAQDAPRVLALLMANPVGGHAVWEAMTAMWEATLAKIPPVLQVAVGFGLPMLISDAAFARRVAAFHRANPIAIGQREVDQAVERMLVGAAFGERVRPELAPLLADVANVRP